VTGTIAAWWKTLPDPWLPIGTTVVLLLAVSTYVAYGPPAHVRKQVGVLPEAGSYRLDLLRLVEERASNAYRIQLYADMGFAAAYSAGLAIVLHGTFGLALLDPDALPLFALLPAAAFLTDLGEDVLLLRIMRRIRRSADVSNLLVCAARVFTALKFASVGATIVAVFAGAVALGVAGANGSAAGRWRTDGVAVLVTSSLALLVLHPILVRFGSVREPLLLVLAKTVIAAAIVLAVAPLVLGTLDTAVAVPPAVEPRAQGSAWSLEQVEDAFGIGGGGAIADGLRWGGAVAGTIVVVVAVAYRIGWVRQRLVDDRLRDMSAQGLAWKVVSILFGTVLLEEVAFRGLMLRSWDSRYPEATAIAVASIVFGLWHVAPAIQRVRHGQPSRAVETGPRVASGVVTTVAFTAAAGVGFCLLVRWSGSIVAPIVVHWCANTAGIVGAWFATAGSERPA
jgi:membrane protease YdiL (CAAX protease family)